MSPAAVLLVSASLDVLLGDVRALPHPVRWIGWLAIHLEVLWRRSRLPLYVAGTLFTATVVVVCAAVVRITLPWASVYWVWMFLAIRSLENEAEKTMALLGDLPAARAQLSTIVGRDTEHLGEAEIVRAVIETVSENFSDAIVAPLFWFAVGGPIGMTAYKAVNTLDSMVGYRNARYREFGWASARLDDVMNWIPARLSVAIIACAGWSWRAVSTAIRDGASQPSPNSGYPEAAFAGVLGVQLGGTSSYGGVASDKARLGEPLRELTPDVWYNARKLYRSASFVAVALATAAVWVQR